MLSVSGEDERFGGDSCDIFCEGLDGDGVDDGVALGVDYGDGVGVAVCDVETVAGFVDGERGGMKADFDLCGDGCGLEVDARDGAGGGDSACVDYDSVGLRIGAGGGGLVAGAGEASSPVADVGGGVFRIDDCAKWGDAGSYLREDGAGGEIEDGGLVVEGEGDDGVMRSGCSVARYGDICDCTSAEDIGTGLVAVIPGSDEFYAGLADRGHEDGFVGWVVGEALQAGVAAAVDQLVEDLVRSPVHPVDECASLGVGCGVDFTRRCAECDAIDAALEDALYARGSDGLVCRDGSGVEYLTDWRLDVGGFGLLLGCGCGRACLTRRTAFLPACRSGCSFAPVHLRYYR